VTRPICVLAILIVALFPRVGFACICSETGSVADELQASQAVFFGRIIALTIDTLTVDGTPFERMRATFKVERGWKGAKESQIDVFTCGDQVSLCTCGVDFRLGGRYLVFASGQPLGTGSCDRTRPTGATDPVISELDKLVPAATGRITTR
jgi:hypothetical protein